MKKINLLIWTVFIHIFALIVSVNGHATNETFPSNKEVSDWEWRNYSIDSSQFNRDYKKLKNNILKINDANADNLRLKISKYLLSQPSKPSNNQSNDTTFNLSYEERVFFLEYALSEYAFEKFKNFGHSTPKATDMQVIFALLRHAPEKETLRQGKGFAFDELIFSRYETIVNVYSSFIERNGQNWYLGLKHIIEYIEAKGPYAEPEKDKVNVKKIVKLFCSELSTKINSVWEVPFVRKNFCKSMFLEKNAITKKCDEIRKIILGDNNYSNNEDYKPIDCFIRIFQKMKDFQCDTAFNSAYKTSCQ